MVKFKKESPCNGLQNLDRLSIMIFRVSAKNLLKIEWTTDEVEEYVRFRKRYWH